MHVCLLTTTYNRPEALAQLYASCDAEARAAGVQLTRCVVDDASTTPYVLHPGVQLVRRNVMHRGRDGYWQTVMHLWQLAQLVDNVDLYCVVQDDVTWYPGGLADAVTHWQAITDPQARCLNILVDTTRRHGPCWTGYPPELVRFGGHAVYHTQWVDGFYVCGRAFFEALDWQVFPIDRRRWVSESSGVGAQISHRLHQAGFSLYQMPHSLLRHGDSPSLMHPVIRLTEPLHA